MTKELLYTSAPKGLKPGSSGFCTVLSTKGMPTPLTSALESISAYRHVFPPGEQQAEKNPISYSHLLLSIARSSNHVISRVADYGLDYSQRTNKIAHHVVLEQSELIPAGPAWLLESSKLLRKEWIEQPRLTPPGPAPEPSDRPLSRCEAWQAMTGDAGWAGVLAESFLSNSQQPVYLIFEPGMDLLPLIVEAIGLLPPKKRWDVTFSTYFTTLPQNAKCQWRCVLKDSPEANESRRFVRSLRIDLTADLGPASGGELVEAARTGKLPTPEDTRLRTGELETQTSTVQFAEYQGGAEPYQLAGSNPTGGPSTRRPPVRPGRRRSAGDENSFSPASKLFLAALLLVVFVGGAVGLVKLFSPKVDEDALVAQSDENKSESPDSNSSDSPKPPEKQQENSETAAPPPVASSEENLKKEKNAETNSTKSAGGDSSKPKKTDIETSHNSKDSESSVAELENSKPAEKPKDQVKYQALPKDGLVNILDTESKLWWNSAIALKVNENRSDKTEIKSIELHIDKSDLDKFQDDFQKRPETEKKMIVLKAKISLGGSIKYEEIAIFSFDKSDVKFEYLKNPSTYGGEKLGKFLSHSLLEVQFENGEKQFVSFEIPRHKHTAINVNTRASTDKQPAALSNNTQLAPLSWTVQLTEEGTSNAYLDNIHLDEVIVKTKEHELHFHRDTKNGALTSQEESVKQLTEFKSHLIEVVRQMTGHLNYEGKPLDDSRTAELLQLALRSSVSKKEMGSLIVSFETLNHANGIAESVIDRITKDVRIVHIWMESDGNDFLKKKEIPSKRLLSLDDLKSFMTFTMYLEELSKMLKDGNQENNSLKTVANNHLEGVNKALKLVPQLQKAAEQLQGLASEFEDAEITELKAYREFSLDNNKTKSVTIKVLELDSEESKEK